MIEACLNSGVQELMKYCVCMTTDRTQFVTITESMEDFIENLSTHVFKLTRHVATQPNAKVGI